MQNIHPIPVTTESSPEPASQSPRRIASPWHTLLVLAILSINAYFGLARAAQARAGFGPSRSRMYLRTMLFELLFLATVVVGVRLHQGSLRTIFGPRWRSVRQVVRDLALGVSLLLVSFVAVAILGGHAHGAQPDQSISYLLPQASLELLLWIVLSIIAGICEEAIYRGYFQRQFTAFTGSVPAGILISAAAFGAAHSYQGLQRAVVIGLSAVLFGLVAQWRGTVRPGMIAHTLRDAIAPLLIKLLRH